MNKKTLATLVSTGLLLLSLGVLEGCSRIQVSDFPLADEDLPVMTTKNGAEYITIWAANDPGQLGRPETQQLLIDRAPGAEGQPHTRLAQASHFLQDDQGAESARLMIDFITANPAE
jgi:hypothetical protein